MQYDPEEYECEPQEHDELAVKVLALVKDEVKAKMTETVETLEMFRKTNESLGASLRKEREEHRKLKLNYEKELEQAKKDGIKEGERKFCTGFTVNDTVYYAKNDYSQTACEVCKGKGKLPVIIAGKDSTADCPHCKHGRIEHDNYIPVSDTVNSLKFWVSEVERGYPHKGAELKVDWDIDVYLKKYDSHMRRRSLFKTLEECQAHCDEKNKPEEVTP